MLNVHPEPNEFATTKIQIDAADEMAALKAAKARFHEMGVRPSAVVVGKSGSGYAATAVIV